MFVYLLIVVHSVVLRSIRGSSRGAWTKFEFLPMNRFICIALQSFVFSSLALIKFVELLIAHRIIYVFVSLSFMSFKRCVSLIFVIPMSRKHAHIRQILDDL